MAIAIDGPTTGRDTPCAVTSPHAALGSFQVLQEVAWRPGRPAYLARSKAGSLVIVRELGTHLEPDQISSLSKEVSLGARLSSTAVLQTRSLVLADRYAALVSEFVPGVSLQRLLRFATGRGVRLPDLCASYILERVLAALTSAHAVKDAAGNPSPVLHRKLVPESVAVGWDGTVKVGDFGLSRMWEIAAEHDGGDRDALATSPEEARNETVDTRADVYAAAVLAVRLATGRTPFARFRDAGEELAAAVAAGDVARLAKTRPDLPAPLRDAIDAALEAERDARFTTAEDLLAVVRETADGEAGKTALAALLGRWRQPLEATVTPWQARASISDDVPDEATGLVKENTLTLVTRDESPSEPAMRVGGGLVNASTAEEEALAPTGAMTSLSRIGSIAPDALVMPLPALRPGSSGSIPPEGAGSWRAAMPSLPTYGGTPVNIPRPPPKQGLFTGKVAAAVVATMFIVLVAGTVILFRWLLHR